MGSSSTTVPPTEPTTSTTAGETPTASAPVGPALVVVTKSGVVAPVVRAETGSWVVRTPCGNEARITQAKPVHEADVVLDPGHGGDEPGAVSDATGLTEKFVNLGVAREVERALVAEGLSVVLTRYTDIRITLDARAAIVTALKPKAFVSVHHNSEPDGPHDGPGSETYYQYASAESKRLAGLIYEEVVRTLRNYQIEWVGDSDAGAKFRRSSVGDDYYGILRKTQGTPAALAELAFISNPPEANLMRRPEYHGVAGQAVANGISRFLNSDDPGSGFVAGYTRTAPAGSGGGARGCVDPPMT